jgi:YfiH family protein
MYSFRTSDGPADLAFTDRYGGATAPDFAPGDVYCYMRQVHGAEVVVAAAAVPEPPHCDGIVTTERGLTLVARGADCAPVLFVAPDEAVVGAAHAGRPGLVAGVVPATIARMRELGAGRIEAWLGPHVCGRCYEVPAELREEVAAAVPESYAETSWGTPAVDIGAGVRAQLERDGVTIHDVSRCTIESEDLFSYRREGKAAGRQAGFVRLRDPA